MLPAIYISYIPIKLILLKWLPQYSQSLLYLAILLPICIFDGKTQMLNNTYFKVLREENTLLKINLITAAMSIVFSLVAVFILGNINYIIIGILLSICVRSILGEIILSKQMNLPIHINKLLFCVISSILFIIYNFNFNDYITLTLTTITYIIYLISTDSHKYIIDFFIKLKKQHEKSSAQ